MDDGISQSSSLAVFGADFIGLSNRSRGTSIAEVEMRRRNSGAQGVATLNHSTWEGTCGGLGRVDFNAGRDRRTQLENGRAPICDAMRKRKLHG